MLLPYGISVLRQVLVLKSEVRLLVGQQYIKSRKRESYSDSEAKGKSAQDTVEMDATRQGWDA